MAAVQVTSSLASARMAFWHSYSYTVPDHVAEMVIHGAAHDGACQPRVLRAMMMFLITSWCLSMCDVFTSQ